MDVCKYVNCSYNFVFLFLLARNVSCLDVIGKWSLLHLPSPEIDFRNTAVNKIPVVKTCIV
jgi:hypothetical protein